MNLVRQTLPLYIVLSFLMSSIVLSQPKFSIHFGGGYYNPSLGYLDPDSNSAVPSLGKLGKNVLIDFGVKYQFYPNTRLGYSQSTSFHSGKMENTEFLRLITYRMISLETFFFPREKFEINFLLAPMINKGTMNFKMNQLEVNDVDALLTNFGNPNNFQMNGNESAYKYWLGFASMIGMRYYISPWLSVEGNLGYFQNFYSNEDWKLKVYDEKFVGPKMDIKELPVFNLHLVFGW